MHKRTTRLAWVLFGYYLLALVWIILFKMSFSLAQLDRIRAVNLIPFAESMYADGRINRSELVNNILVFIPLGVYLSVLCGQWPFWRKLGSIFGVSLLLELLQYAFSVGVSDVTDLMGNTLGGVIGLGVYALALWLCKDRDKANRLFVILASIGSACLTALLLLLLRGG